jgi:CheY-like chemotaxis protein
MMAQPSKHSVLLVDDEPAIRGLLSSRLEQAGFEAQQAQDGIDGLMKLRQRLPHLIISDNEMPRMSGIEFVIVVHRRFPQLPVIMVSGSPQSIVPAEAMPDAWFPKGALQFDELLEAVHNLVRNIPDSPSVPQVINLPLRTRPDGTGYFVLTCTDCLRSFRMPSDPKIKTVERTASCIYCQASLPFLIESSDPS